MAGCHTVLTPIEKQSGQQVLYACHLSYLSEWVEDIMLSNQYTTCSTTVWFILKQTHEEMRVPSCGDRHELQWKVVLGNHTSSTAHWDAPCSYDYEWRITEREHKFNTGAPLQHSKVINPPAKKFRLGSNQSKQSVDTIDIGHEPLFQRAYYHLDRASILLVRPENAQYKSLHVPMETCKWMICTEPSSMCSV